MLWRQPQKLAKFDCRSTSMKKKQKEEIVDTKKRWIEKFTQPTEGPSQEIEEYEYNNRRLVVSYCPKKLFEKSIFFLEIILMPPLFPLFPRKNRGRLS